MSRIRFRRPGAIATPAFFVWFALCGCGKPVDAPQRGEAAPPSARSREPDAPPPSAKPPSANEADVTRPAAAPDPLKIKRVQDRFEELVRMANAGRYDDAWALAPHVAEEAAACGERDLVAKTKQIWSRLDPQHTAVFNLLERAGLLERQGNYARACATVEQLHMGYSFWKAAREARFPFGIEAAPAGVRIYVKRKDDTTWPKEPIAISKARADGTIEPFVLHLDYGHGEFVLRLEREGFVPRERVVRDEREGGVRVDLAER